MKKKILAVGVLLSSMGAFADDFDESVSENILERELRETVECLTAPIGNVGSCDLADTEETFTGVITDDFTGVISSSEDLIVEGRTISGLDQIYIRYSANAGSATAPTKFAHTQDCASVKSLIELDFKNDRPSSLEPGDEGAAFGANAYYSCEASSDLTDMGVTASSVSGSSQVTTGQEVETIDEVAECYGVVGYRGGVLKVDCGTYGIIWASASKAEGANVLSCNNPGYHKWFQCTFRFYEDWDYEYKRYFEVTASPLSLDNDSESGEVNDIDYEVSIDYVYQKQRTLPVEQWPKGWVPVQVGDITTFVWAPVGPSFPVMSYESQLVNRAEKSVNAKNSTKLTLGCDAKSRTLDMTNKSDQLILEFSDVNNLINHCDEFSVSIDDLSPIEDVHWKVEYSWSPSEEKVWEKYAVFLTEEISDSLISSDYIYQLQNATDESTNDSQLIIKTLSEYILGDDLSSGGFVRTGLYGFLYAQASNYSISDIEAEINSITETDGDYGELIFNLNDEGAVIKDSVEGEAEEKPAYWSAFSGSSYARNVDFLTNFNLLKQAKNIIDVSDAGGDTSTLQDQMDVVAEAAQKESEDIIYKSQRFLGNISIRSDIEKSLCPTLNTLRTELALTTEVCEP